MQPEHGCAITGWASALPSTVVTNQDIMTLFDTSDDWIVERTGIRQRRAADGPFVHPKPSVSPPEGMGTTAQMAAEAGRSALSMAGVTGADIDLLVLCTTTPDQLVPATSSPLAHALAIKGGGMDLNAACAGFTYGLVTAAGFIASGAQRVLLIGAEPLTQRQCERKASKRAAADHNASLC